MPNLRLAQTIVNDRTPKVGLLDVDSATLSSEWLVEAAKVLAKAQWTPDLHSKMDKITHANMSTVWSDFTASLNQRIDMLVDMWFHAEDIQAAARKAEPSPWVKEYIATRTWIADNTHWELSAKEPFFFFSGGFDDLIIPALLSLFRKRRQLEKILFANKFIFDERR